MSGHKTAGPGFPTFFRCSACRRAHDSHQFRRRRGWVMDVELTGRKRRNPSTNRHSRVSGMVREYRCLDCGHVGWSNHKDLERLEDRLNRKGRDGD